MGILDNKLVKNVLVAVLLAGGGYAVGRFAQPAKVITKTEVKEVEKIVEVEKKTKQTDKVVKVIEKTNPDGSKTKETTIVDKTKEVDTSKTNTEVESESNSSKVVENQARYNARVLAAYQFGPTSNLLGQSLILGVGVDTRIAGPFSVGVFGLSNKTIGASVGMGF